MGSGGLLCSVLERVSWASTGVQLRSLRGCGVVDVDRWGGVNVVRAVQALRGVVGVTAGFPVETLDRLVVVGRALGPGRCQCCGRWWTGPLMWGGWELVDEAAGELMFGLDRRAQRGLAVGRHG